MDNTKSYRYCSLKTCKVTSKDQVTMFECPNDKETRDKWKIFLQKHGNKICDKISLIRLCEYHFSLDDISITTKMKRLKKGSVPVYDKKKVKHSLYPL